MKNNYKSVIIVAILILIIVGFYFFRKDTALAPVITDNDNKGEVMDKTYIEGNKDDLISFSIWPGTRVSGIRSYRGEIKGGYFFEGNILINILDAKKKVLKSSNAVATTEWMTAEGVKFEGNIDFTGLPTGLGYIEIHNDNASGLPEHDKSVLVPIIIEATPVVKSQIIDTPLSSVTSCASNDNLIKVLYPNGGEMFTVGQSITIKWISCGNVKNSDVYVGLTNLTSGDIPLIQTDNIPNKNSLTVKIPDSILGPASILVDTYADGVELSDTSDANFLVFKNKPTDNLVSNITSWKSGTWDSASFKYPQDLSLDYSYPRVCGSGTEDHDCHPSDAVGLMIGRSIVFGDVYTGAQPAENVYYFKNNLGITYDASQSDWQIFNTILTTIKK